MATTKEFVTYSPNTGNKNASISVTAKENTSSSTRSMKLNTSKNGINKEVNIMQKAKISSDTVLLMSSTYNEKIQVNPSSGSIKSGGTIGIHCLSNNALTVLSFDAVIDKVERVTVDTNVTWYKISGNVYQFTNSNRSQGLLKLTFGNGVIVMLQFVNTPL